MVEVCAIVRGFEGTDEVIVSKRGVGGTREHDWKLFKKPF